ncbi:MAG: alkaline phosphatase family protein [Bacteroidota bacterium]
MRIKIMLSILFAILVANLPAWTKPSLVVVISLDQFRYDYLVRFREHFGPDGFNYLLDNGANFSNATYKHALNMTGPGHAVILSGAYGNQNGIIANNWFDRASGKDMYCVADKNAQVVGAAGHSVSPQNFVGSTFGDELRLHTGFQSKVISVSNKDRAAVLLGGKLASGVYWMMDSSFVTSTYYRKDLPAWVSTFNTSGKVNSYFGRMWERTLPEDAYAGMDKDDVPYENGGNGLGRVFPHTITGDDRAKITKSYYYALLTSPFGNEILSEFAKAAVQGEELGRRGVTDLLCVGFSSNDYVGHSFGPHSHEVLDMTVQTDRMLADLFAFLDVEVGLRNCIFVLTSDHGVAPIPEYVTTHYEHADAGRVPTKTLEEYVVNSLTHAYGAPKKDLKWLEAITDGNVYLNHGTLEEMERDKKSTSGSIATTLADSLRAKPEFAFAYTRDQLLSLIPSSVAEQRMKASFHPLRSGDVLFAFKPYYIEGYSSYGTTHGQPYDYDAHVPVVIVADGIRSGSYSGEASPADIAPTLSALLGIEFPAGRSGRVLIEAIK